MSGPAPSDDGPDLLTPSDAGAMLTRVRAEISRVIVGQQRVVDRVLVALLGGGHCLLEGAPGLGKTRLLTTLATTLGGTFSRIQFTPDLLPSDIVGTRIWRQEESRFTVELGPVFANFVLTDEINRAPAKVQSALLEVMAERQVTIGGETHRVPGPFLVLATQNPIESEGVYALPEAQRDRFLMKVPVDYPAGPHEELEIVRRAAGDAVEPVQVLDVDEVRSLQATTRAVHVDPRVADYAVRLVMATRYPDRHGLDQLRGMVAFGASPRASIGLVEGGRAMALLRGRGSVSPQDVYDIAYDVLNHRLVLSFDAVADGVTVDEVLYHLLTTVPAPHAAPLHASSSNGPSPAGPPEPRSATTSPALPVPATRPSEQGERLGAASPYGVARVDGGFPGQRDSARGRGRDGVQDGPVHEVPVPAVLAPDHPGPPELPPAPPASPAAPTPSPAEGLLEGSRSSSEADGRPAADDASAQPGPRPLSPPA